MVLWIRLLWWSFPVFLQSANLALQLADEFYERGVLITEEENLADVAIGIGAGFKMMNVITGV